MENINHLVMVNNNAEIALHNGHLTEFVRKKMQFYGNEVNEMKECYDSLTRQQNNIFAVINEFDTVIEKLMPQKYNEMIRGKIVEKNEMLRKMIEIENLSKILKNRNEVLEAENKQLLDTVGKLQTRGAQWLSQKNYYEQQNAELKAVVAHQKAQLMQGTIKVEIKKKNQANPEIFMINTGSKDELKTMQDTIEHLLNATKSKK